MLPADLITALRTRRLLAIVRGSDPRMALSTVITLVEEGIDVVEVSLTCADALGVLARARRHLGPDTVLGAGTVVTPRQAHLAAEAGAAFVVTPGVTDAVAEARDLGLPVLAGAVTPTEVASAVDEGATAVKLFPASLGGVPHLRALRDPFPEVSFVPVGGVDARTARDYLAAGATAVGVGGPLVGDAASGGSPAGLGRRIAEFRAVAQEVAS
ncbi:bifunctional 4-hydroxy-2-oxoglutarate aldolase/2-dehydro-3-deoxy-phosphogluconate aldolase [Streptomyces sp. NPDC001922]|uniref:bifunctional 4-hydroxy-2-oxoglutarate aldolase/2-dehydro-3-deoxy-phosphogluconate aldolase n=1 Tax=Streptomyces sp. NPDC001922 TaxID=3364624 RepID=UPI0036753799